ncbi:MAG: stage II sporulation protein M [Oscillospiraceae bacterium]|nr:stage II sporulation protein M [Oscillospiraceae bacterium]
MNRKLLIHTGTVDREFWGLALCLIFFACGILIGTISVGNLDTAEILALQSSMSRYIAQIADGTYSSPTFFSVFWSLGKYHLLVVFLGFSLLGILGLPVISGIRGFYLSFSISAFIQAFGVEGWPVAFSLFGTSALIAIPCFFLLASQSFSASATLGKALIGSDKLRAGTLYGSHYLVRTTLCFIGILAAVLIELYVTPALVSWTSVVLK